jgi:hypothetical protein
MCVKTAGRETGPETAVRAARVPGAPSRPRAGYAFWFLPGGTGGKDSVGAPGSHT